MRIESWPDGFFAAHRDGVLGETLVGVYRTEARAERALDAYRGDAYEVSLVAAGMSSKVAAIWHAFLRQLAKSDLTAEEVEILGWCPYCKRKLGERGECGCF